MTDDPVVPPTGGPVPAGPASRSGALLAAAGLGAAALSVGGAGRAFAAAASPDLTALSAAAGIEVVAVKAYTAAQGLAFVKGGNPTVAAFVTQTRKDHEQAIAGLRLIAGYLGGTVPTTTANPTYAAALAKAAPGLTGYGPLVALAMTFEDVALASYTALTSSGKLTDKRTRGLFVGLAAQAAQHLAVLRAVKALLAGGAPQLIALDKTLGVASKLPAAAGGVGFPDAFVQTGNAAEVQL